MTDTEALTEAQKMIIQKGSDESYPLKKAIRDIDIIADISELKIRLRMIQKRKVPEKRCLFLLDTVQNFAHFCPTFMDLKVGFGQVHKIKSEYGQRF